jgi:hypothetical protein
MNTPTKKLYRIPVEWAVTGIMLVEAESLSDALIEAEDAPLPEAQDYIDGTFEINRGMIQYVNENLTEAEIKDECYETI